MENMMKLKKIASIGLLVCLILALSLRLFSGNESLQTLNDVVLCCFLSLESYIFSKEQKSRIWLASSILFMACSVLHFVTLFV